MMPLRLSTTPPRLRRRPAAMAITIDLEEYFQVEAMAGQVRRADWEAMPPRIEANTARLLEIFAAASARATFFVVGWLAMRYPRLIAGIAAQGHEIGCHSFWHRPVFGLAAGEFRDDTRRAKDAIESATGAVIRGYRAPNFSIRPTGADAMGWALDILAEAGFRYDSSLHPIHHPLYGAAQGPRLPFRIPSSRIYAGLWEFPLATAALFNQRLPMAGGGYWRLAPLAYTRWALRRCLRQGIRPICYLHPWELDPAQPRLPLPFARHFRHYVGLAAAESKLRSLLAEFDCRPIESLYAAELGESAIKVAA